MRLANLPGPPRPHSMAVALLACVALAACGGKGGSTSPSASSTNSAQVAAARRALCHDLVQIGGGAFRVPNLERLLPKLKADRKQLARAGDEKLAGSVDKLETAVHKLISALQSHGNLNAANEGMLQALGSMPSC